MEPVQYPAKLTVEFDPANPTTPKLVLQVDGGYCYYVDLTPLPA
jgi:hypothetical protein